MNIYVTEPEETHPSALDLLKKQGHRILTKPPKKENVDVLFIRTYTKIDSRYLDLFPHVMYILRVGVGLDNIDLAECKRRRITVINAPGSNANAVSEYAVAVILMLARRIPQQTEALRKGAWRNRAHMGYELRGKLLGLVGCGAIGRLLAAKLRAFGIADVLGFDPYLTKEQLSQSSIQKVELQILLQDADIVSLHLPLTSETRNLIRARQFDLMKQNAILINSSRGGIVSEPDLINALKTEQIAGAALDVFETEPDVRKELLSLENLIATPHIAGYTYEADEEMAVMPVKIFLEKLST